MHAENTISIAASPERVFNVASDLAQWPMILPHYRRIAYLKRSESSNIVMMSAWRVMPLLPGIRIPVRWTSEQQIDRQKMEVRFHHLKALTKGMRVVWSFVPSGKATNVRIVHDLDSEVPVLGKLIIEPVVGSFFVHFIANQTLRHMKSYLENHHEQ
jgi:aromatase